MAQQRTLQRINYFRRLLGLNDDIVFDESKNIKCQEAALMMKANNDLDHYPPGDWKCYTSEGAETAGYSNLHLGSHSSKAIDSFIKDNGSTDLLVLE